MTPEPSSGVFSMNMNPSPILFLFPVPLGATAPSNVLPPENIHIIKSIRYFIVENIRSARRFLKACDKNISIDDITFFELNRHTKKEEIDSMISPMANGFSMGIISEAGCPAVADPGADVVALAHRKGYTIRPLIGPSSIILALMASGFNGQSFSFNGYLPIDPAQRSAKIHEMERRIRHDDQTQIFIETPYRNNKLIKWLCDNINDNIMLCVASDLSNEGENITTLPIRKWKSRKYDYDKIPTIFLLHHS